MPPDKPTRGPRIHLPPPLLVAAWFFSGLGIDRVLPLRVPEFLMPIGRLVGGGAVVLGMGLAFWTMWLFRRAGTTVLPFKAATTLVIEGPFRRSRNPIYTGLLLVYAGAGLWSGLVWVLLLVPLVLASLRGLAIDAEEAHLTERFGNEYQQYRQRVRRWL